MTSPPHRTMTCLPPHRRYVREEIDWSNISFPDNVECLELIDSRRPAGLLALLDEQCLLQVRGPRSSACCR